MSEKFNSTCSYCGVGCGVTVIKDRRGRLDLVGNESYPSNSGRLCSKGMNLHHVVQDQSDRLLKPKMRMARNHDMKEVSWDEAMKRSAAAFKSIIKKYGSDSVGLYVSGQLLTEEYYLANKLTKGFLGTNNIDTNSRLCMSSAVVGYKMTIGDDAPPISYDDIEATDCFFIAGANPAWCHPILFRRIEAHIEANPSTKMIVVDPRKTQTAEMADLHLQITPGSDVYLYNAIASLLYSMGAVDRDFLNNYCNGAEELEYYLKTISLKTAARECGLELGEIEQAAKMIAESKTLLSMWTMGLNQSSIGTNKNLSLINLNLITGRIGRPGCGPFSLTGQPNAMGGREVGGLANLLAAHHDLTSPDDCRKVEDFWGVDHGTITPKPGLTATQMIEAMNEGKLKAIWVICTNPAVSLPDLEMVESAFEKAKFVMVSDISDRADTIRFADVVLPAAGWLEKEGTMTNSDRRISYLPKVTEAPGEARPDVDILMHFAKEMGWEKSFTYKNAEAIYNEHRALTKGTNIDITGVSYERLKQGSIQWPCPSEDHPGTPRLFEDKKFFTPNGKASVHCVDPELQSEELSEEFPLVLTTGRIRDQWHTMTRTGKVNKLTLHIDRPLLEIHPEDAKELKLEDNDYAKISNVRGSVEVQVQVADTIKKGCVFLAMHWGRNANSGKALTNVLTSMIVDPKSKEPDFKYSAVKVEKIEKPRRKIILVGAGAASLEFIHKYRLQNQEDEIHVFGKEPYLFYNRVLLPEYINEEKSWDAISSSEEEELRDLNVTFHRAQKITTINREHCTVISENGETHRYDKLIIATGSRPARPEKTPRLEGIFGLRTRNDADAIKRYLNPNENALIVGGGLLGLELAGSLASLGINVTIIQRSARLMRGQLDVMGSKILHEEILDRGIKVIYNDEVKRFIGNGRLDSIQLKSGRYLQANALFFAAGIEPNIEIGVDAGLKKRRGLLVNNQMMTSDPNIYAIGEVAEHKKVLYGNTPAAQEQARVVASHLTGDPGAAYSGSLAFNILKIKDLELCSIGRVSFPEEEDVEEVTILDERMNYYKKCFIKYDRLVGAILIGDKSEFIEYKELIEKRLELGEKRLEILKSGAEPKEAPIGAMVCSCNNVGEGNITRLIQEGCCKLDDICNKTGAGTGCGSCRPEVQRILNTSLLKAKEMAGAK